MQYTIYHDDIAVCTVDVGPDYRIHSLVKMHTIEHFPIGVAPEPGGMNDWLYKRAIPEKREGLSLILERENAENIRELLIKNLGLGLSDHYWIKNDKEKKTWKEVNFFENDFGKRGDDIYLGYEDTVEEGITPNSNSSGMLPKKWIIKDDARYLLKGHETVYRQEPFNEAIVSEFLERLNIDHVDYQFIQLRNKPYSICKNMAGKDTELINAIYVYNNDKKDKKTSNYYHYIGQCAKLGIKGDIRKEIDKMIVCDYLTANTDRHWFNFGVIRNAHTLEAVKIAPIFDNGASFYYNDHHLDIMGINENLSCKSFKSRQQDVIKYVSDFSWLNYTTVDELPEIMKEGFRKNKYMDSIRLDAITKGIRERTTMLKKYASG